MPYRLPKDASALTEIKEKIALLSERLEKNFYPWHCTRILNFNAARSKCQKLRHDTGVIICNMGGLFMYTSHFSIAGINHNRAWAAIFHFFCSGGKSKYPGAGHVHLWISERGLFRGLQNPWEGETFSGPPRIIVGPCLQDCLYSRGKKICSWSRHSFHFQAYLRIIFASNGRYGFFSAKKGNKWHSLMLKTIPFLS